MSKKELSDFDKAFNKQWRADLPVTKMELAPDVYKDKISKLKISSDIQWFRKRFKRAGDAHADAHAHAKHKKR